MRLGKTSWIILGIGILIIAAITLYMLYRGQMSEQESLNDNLASENAAIQLINIQIQALEDELAQLESDLEELEGENSQLEADISQLEAELSQLEAEREQAIEQALLSLAEAEAKFFSSVESIEYDEVLFGFAHDANLEVGNLTVSGPTDEDIEGITYTTTSFTIKVRGEVADIISFINTIVTDEAFKTAILGPVNMGVPEPLSDSEKEDIEGAIRAELTAAAEAGLTTEDLVRFMLEAIAEVTGEPQIEKTMTIEAIAELVRERIADLLGEDYANSLSQELALLIEEHVDKSIIEGVIRDKIVGPIAKGIADLLLEQEGILIDDLEDLLGEKIAEYLGEDIAGLLPGDIEELLKGYINNLAAEKKAELVAELVDDALVAELAAEQIEAMETSSSDITLVIYTYQGE